MTGAKTILANLCSLRTIAGAGTLDLCCATRRAFSSSFHAQPSTSLPLPLGVNIQETQILQAPQPASTSQKKWLPLQGFVSTPCPPHRPPLNEQLHTRQGQGKAQAPSWLLQPFSHAHLSTTASSRAPSDALEPLTTRLEALEGRLELLEGEASIRKLVNALAFKLDSFKAANHEELSKEALKDLFTKSCSLQADGVQPAEGLEEVASALQQLRKQVSFSRHYVANLHVTMDKEGDHDSGSARFYYLTASTMKGHGAVWSMETVALEVQRGFDDGKWRIQSLKCEEGAIVTPFNGTGWDVAPNVLK